jgi:hypothetical protein
MSKPDIPHLFAISPQSVNEIIHLLELREAGAELYYAVDPFDIIEFCFPVQPDSWREKNIELIADDQAALYEILIRRMPRPLLVNDYKPELQRNVRRLQILAKEAYSKTEMVNELIRLGPHELGAFDKSIQALEKNFNVILAVAMGIYSLGLERLQNIYDERLLFEDSLSPPLLEAMTGYRPSPISTVIYEELARSIPDGEVETEVLRLQRAARADATAIDRLFYLNNCSERLFIDGTFPRRQIFLYLSSAARSERVMRMPAVSNSLPDIGGARLPVLVTKSQVLATVALKPRISQGDADTIDDIRGLITNMRQFHQVCQRIAEFESVYARSNPATCSNCVIGGGTGVDCAWVEVCKLVEQFNSEIKPRTIAIHNLGLLSNVDRYRKFLTSRVQERSQREYIDNFRAICQDQDLGDLALKRLQTVQNSVLFESEFISALPAGFDVESLEQDLIAPTALNSVATPMPLALRIQSSDYQAIAKSVIDAFRGVTTDVRRKRQLLAMACRDFLTLDGRDKVKSDEHEVIRTLLYYALATSGDERLASRHARRMLRRESKFDTEFAYLWLYSEMRASNFEAIEQQLPNWLVQWPKDPRFHQLRSGLIGRLLSGRSASAKEVPKFTWNDALLSAERALRGYVDVRGTPGWRTVDEHYWDEILAMNYNNVAYYALQSDRSWELKLDIADKSMRLAAESVPESEWDVAHPEYLHTMAYLEYMRFIHGGESGAAKNSILVRATEYSERALKSRPKPLYRELTDKLRQLHIEASEETMAE